MRIMVDYSGKTYGNGTTPKHYRVFVVPSEDRLSVRINFDKTVTGLGSFTENNSRVISASLSMPREHAKAIAEAILEALGAEGEESVILEFGDAPQKNTEAE